MAITMKNSFSLDVTPCDSYKIRLFGGTHGFHHQGGKKERDMNNISTK
jgi:hypothetical protein